MPRAKEMTCARKLSPVTGTPVTRAELARDHDQRHARHVADQDGPRQQVRDEPQPQHARRPAPSPRPAAASVAASAAYRAGSPAASGPIAVAVISAVVASGPIDSDRDEPSSA